jgi:hypothetical protein
MFDSALIRQEISTVLNPVRQSLAPGVLLRIHPDKVADLTIADSDGDVLFLFPSERTVENDRTFSINHQTRLQKVSIVISLPSYYSEIGAGKVAERTEKALENLRVTGALFDLTFDSRREFFQGKRWVVDITFDIVGRQAIIDTENQGTVPQIVQIGFRIL